MAPRCANPACTWNEGGPCARLASLEPEGVCPDLGQVPNRDSTADPALPPVRDVGVAIGQPPLTVYRGPLWSGTALGSEELWNALWATDSRLFLVAGSENAGKTCLLVGMWVELANGRVSDSSWRFAASRSLRGWTQLADAAFEWKGNFERVVPRTSLSDVRQPSFLHLQLSRDLGRTSSQILLSDLPGEWFEKWIMRREAGSEYLPMLPRVDGAILVVDTPRLLSDDEYLEDCVFLRDRIREVMPRMRRPIAVVLAKIDTTEVSAGAADSARMETWPEKLRKRTAKLCNGLSEDENVHVFATSVVSDGAFGPSQTFAPVLWLLDQTNQPAAPLVAEALRPKGGHPFTCLRERPGQER